MLYGISKIFRQRKALQLHACVVVAEPCSANLYYEEVLNEEKRKMEQAKADCVGEGGYAGKGANVL